MSRRAGGYLAILLSLGVALAAVLGPLVLEVIEFRLGENAITQFRGGEIVSLAIVAPLLIVAGALWLRGHPLAPVLAIGPALYAAYTYTSAVLGQEYARYEGNVEKFYPLFAGLVLGGLVVAMLSWMWLAEEPASARPYAAHRALAWAFIILGAFFALTWAAQIRLVYTGDPPEEYNEGPTLFWLIKFLDFALCIPVLIATGIGLRRGVATARRAALAVGPFAACLIGAVCAMAIAMQVTDDPSASPILLVATAAGTATLAVVVVRLVRDYGQAAGREPGL